MSKLSDRLAATMRRWHIDERRLDEIAAEASSGPHAESSESGLVATSAELAHLQACRRCRSLLVGFGRTSGVLAGVWADRSIGRRAEIPNGAGRVRLGRPTRVEAHEGRGVPRRAAIPAAVAAILVGVVATAGLLVLRVGVQPASSAPGESATHETAQVTAGSTPQRTGLVARLPLGGQFSWSPDGNHLLVSLEYESDVYDRFGNRESSFGQYEGWLDATHVIAGDGHVAGIDQPYSGGPQSNSWVVASGHGAAAIIVAVPGCVGDPIIDWYRNGQYVKAGEQATPYGWSPDGSLLLLGHMSCSSADGEASGWKGRVDVVDFASGRILATAPNVRGQMAFNPSATELAAQSDADLEVVTVEGGQVRTITGARFLSWLDDSHLYYMAGTSVMSLDLASGSTGTVVGSGDWQIPSAAGPQIVVDKTGVARRIVGADGSTLIDLSSASLAVAHMLPLPATFLEQQRWSPDGRMLAIDSFDGTSLALFSVTDLPGSIGSALPTPIGSPQTIVELDRMASPWPVGHFLSDPKRNAFWFIGGDAGKTMDLYRYDVATAKLSITAIEGTVYNESDPRDSLAIAPDGRLWIGAGLDLIVYAPDTADQTSLTLPASGPDVQSDPALGQPDPWITGIAFDAAGNVLIARNWVRSLAQVDTSLHVTGRVDVSDGFPMTGGLVVAGGGAYVLADPASGLCFGVDATGTGKLSNTKFQASGLAAVGDRVLAAGTPPGWIDANGGAAMIEPVMASADLVAAGPDGTSVLYSQATGEMQWRDEDGKVSAQGVFRAGTAPQIAALGFDGQGRQWAVESLGGAYSLVRLSLGA